MVLESINSSNIESAGYDPTNNTMILKFRSGVFYEYLKVPELVYEHFKKADSKGAFFSQNIRNVYACNKIDVS